MQINFNKLDVSLPETISGLKLVQRSGQSFLLLSKKDRLLETPIPALEINPSLNFTEVDKLNSILWDARPAEKAGSYVTLYTLSGSAFVWAMIKTPEYSNHRLHMETFAVYSQPLFAKGQGPNEYSVTAILFNDGKSIPVIFPRLQTFDKPYVALKQFSNPIKQVRLLQTTNDYWLFMLQQDEEMNFDTTRNLLSGISRPSSLKVVHLDNMFRPTTIAVTLFGQTPLYEFDVDVTQDDEVVVFATTPQGILFAHGILSPGQPMDSSDWNIIEMEAPLVSPSALVNDESIYLAAISNLGSPEASVVYSVISTPG